MRPEVMEQLREAHDICSLTKGVLELCEPYGPVHSFRLVHNRGAARVVCFIELEAQRAQGTDVRVLLPRYREIDPAGAEERAPLRLLGMEVRVLEKGDFLLLECPALYDRDGGPYQDAAGADWPDNALRFGVLSRAAALLSSSASPLA